jgi:hypothetical protein
MVHDFLTSMYTNGADFVFTGSRDVVRSIQTPLLIAPDDVPAHPYKVAMEVASLARTSRTRAASSRRTNDQSLGIPGISVLHAIEGRLHLEDRVDMLPRGEP